MPRPGRLHRPHSGGAALDDPPATCTPHPAPPTHTQHCPFMYQAAPPVAHPTHTSHPYHLTLTLGLALCAPPVAAAAGSFDLSRLPCNSCLLAIPRCLTRFLLSLGLSLCCLLTSSRWPIVTSIKVANEQAGRGRGCMQAGIIAASAAAGRGCTAAVHGRLFCIPRAPPLSVFLRREPTEPALIL